MKNFLICLCAFVLLACGGSPTEKSDEGLLGISITDALKADCPSGGVVINQGIDKNGNGAIDSSEITSSESVCNGTDNHITSRIYCAGPIGSTSIYYYYNIVGLSSGDVLVYGSINDAYWQISGMAFYSSEDNGAASGGLSIANDLNGSANAGWWQIEINKTTLVVTIVYHDFDVPGGEDTFTQSSTQCKRITY